MESYDLLMKGGEDGPALVPGKADESVLVKQIEHKAKPFMPPKKAKDTLNPEEIALIRNWIDGGAPAPAPGEKVPAAVPVISVPHIEPKVAPRKPIRAVAWSASAKLIAVAQDERIKLMSVEDRAVLRELHVEAGSVNAMAFSADGATLAAGAGEPGVRGEIDLWKVADGSRVKHLEGHTDAVYSLALSADGKTLASGSYDNKIVLWDLESGQAKQTLDGHNGAIPGLDFRPDGSVLASASADRTVKLWNVKTGERLDTFAESLKELNSVRFTPDGSRVIAGGADNRIRIWQLSPTAKEGTNKLLVAQFAHEGAILRLAISTDGKLLASCADDRTVKLWNPEPTSAGGSPELKMLRVLPPQSDWPVSATFAADNKTLVVGRLDGTLGFYDANTGAEIPPPKPELTGVEPRGLQRGVAGRLTLKGKRLSDLSSVTLLDASGKTVSRGMGVSPMQTTLSEKDRPAQQAPTESQVELTPPADLPLGPYELKVAGPGGESGSVKVFVDDLPQVAEREPNDELTSAQTIALPADVWGAFERRGDQDTFAFDGKAGQTIVLDAASQRLGSQAKLVVDLLDPAGRLLASSNGFDGDPEPLLAYKLAADGRYAVRVSEAEASASDAHFYRLSIGSFAYVTGCYPLAITAGASTPVTLLGLNLPADAKSIVNPAGPGEIDVPVDASRFRSRRAIKVLVSTTPELIESEPNDAPDHANGLTIAPSRGGDAPALGGPHGGAV